MSSRPVGGIRTRATGCGFLATFLLVSAPVRAGVIFEPATSLTLGIGTSIRSAAMAGAGSALFWGEPDVWANPATLSGLRGVGWQQGHSQLNPSFDDDVVFDTQQVLFGGAGIGASVMGQPFSGLGRARFESAPITIDTGSGIETFTVYEQTESFALGISPLRVVDALRASAGSGQPRLTDVGEIAVGYQTEHTESGIEPGNLVPFEVWETVDWGVNGRLALGRLLWPEVPFHLDFAAAYSELNRAGQGRRSADGLRRVGFALHGAPQPPADRAAPPASLPWWRPASVPAFTATLAYDRDERLDTSGGIESSADRVGLETEAFRLLALRVGYVSDPEADIHAVAYGGGVTLPVGPWGSAGYQLAYEPLSEGLKPRFRQGWSVWLDPARIWSDALRR